MGSRPACTRSDKQYIDMSYSKEISFLHGAPKRNLLVSNSHPLSQIAERVSHAHGHGGLV